MTTLPIETDLTIISIARRTSLLKSFWQRVSKSSNGCWEWTGSKDSDGYGKIRYWSGQKRKYTRAHRFSWLLYFGVIGDLCVLHKCDNPACCNPFHLFLGTRADNNADCIRKGRANPGRQHGETNPSAKLTSEAVRSIRVECSGGSMQKALAKKYGVTPTTIYQIVHRRIWKHLT